MSSKVYCNLIILQVFQKYLYFLSNQDEIIFIELIDIIRFGALFPVLGPILHLVLVLLRVLTYKNGDDGISQESGIS
jgi:hypothetical protein